MTKPVLLNTKVYIFIKHKTDGENMWYERPNHMWVDGVCVSGWVEGVSASLNVP